MAVKKTAAGAVENGSKLSLVAQNLEEVIKRLDTLMQDFMNIVNLRENLTTKERERLIGAGVRNYGFIEKANDIGKDNPSFLPPNFNMEQFSEILYVFDLNRQFFFLAEKLLSLASDSTLLKSNALYRDSLRVYHSLKEQTMGRVPGARELFDALEPFFRKSKPSESQLTQKQELRRIESVVRGKTEGEILIRNIKPKTTGGVHEVIEEMGSGE